MTYKHSVELIGSVNTTRYNIDDVCLILIIALKVMIYRFVTRKSVEERITEVTKAFYIVTMVTRIFAGC